MTKEITDILLACREAQENGRRVALATVVHVEGSSYRRPGARMLVEDNGKMTGAISGGCLEGDALRKALQAINQQQNKLVTYNTLDEDDVEFGVQLGCNGIVHILFEPILPEQLNNPIRLLEKFFEKKKEAALVTLFSLVDYHGNQPGTCFFFSRDNQLGVELGAHRALLEKEASNVLARKESVLKPIDSQVSAFFEFLEPPVSLFIVGAGNDAFPLVEMASILGWEITVVDGRATHANRHRFPRVHQVLAAKAEDVIRSIVVDERSVFVLMTHNYNYDLEFMKNLLPLNCAYIGALGPRKRLVRLLDELQEQGVVLTDHQKNRIYGPTGLDIGAEAAEEIALSVLSEIKAVLTGRQGSCLRDRAEPIHSRMEKVL